MATNSKSETMLMSGVPVEFPYKPYPCQVAMLGKIIRALQQSKNCLLESPTGTGKTATLLCGVLAWQQKEIERILTSVLDENKENATETFKKPETIPRIFYCTRTHKQLEQVAKQLANTVYKDKIRMTLLSSRNNYCIHPTVSKGPNKNYECSKLTRPDKSKPGRQGFQSGCGYYDRFKTKQPGDFIRVKSEKQVPRVFDIEQFVEYCLTTYAVCPYYSSRLILNEVQVILCPYNYLIDPRIRNTMQMQINNSVIIIDEAHNIEDCARDSMKFELRKYDFELALSEITDNQRALELAKVQAAQLVSSESGFSSTQEPLGSIQSTQTQKSKRRTAGYSEYDQLYDDDEEDVDLLEHLNIDQQGNEKAKTLDSVEDISGEHQEIANALKFLAERLSRLVLWFDTKDPRQKYTFTPKELVQEFHQAKFIDRTVSMIEKLAKNKQQAPRCGIIQDAALLRKALYKTFLNPPDYIVYSDENAKFLENLDLCISVLYADEYQFADDYKITLRTVPFEPNLNTIAQMQNESENPADGSNSQLIDMNQNSSQNYHYRPGLSRTTYPLHTQLLSFYCLSPSVAFAKDLKLARSLIFASGTLAPLATYAGELRIPFDFQLECNHVIDAHRTFITALSHGRNSNVKLRATYQNTDKTEFQDECGLVLLDICERVPYGILCFVPSYRFLNVIMNRWMASGLWQKLHQHKSIFFEEKDSANFHNTINRFREANGTLKIVQPTSAATKRVNRMFRRKRKRDADEEPIISSYFNVKGGLLLAVCRGRASEGIDFSDNNARCVVTLGIPYPNVQDEEVVFKRNYNNEQNRRFPQLLNGSDWYDSQAYRALNQALGRCIRHKNDWGALIIVEERIVNNMSEKNFNNKISLWIKQRLFVSRQYDQTMDALEKFVNEMKTSDEIEMYEREQAEQIQQTQTQVEQIQQTQTQLEQIQQTQTQEVQVQEKTQTQEQPVQPKENEESSDDIIILS